MQARGSARIKPGGWRGVMMGNISDDPSNNGRAEVHSAADLKALNAIFFAELKSRLYGARQKFNYQKLKLTLMAISLSGEEKIIVNFVETVRSFMLVLGKTEQMTISKSYLEKILKNGSKKICFVDYIDLDERSMKSAFDVVKNEKSSLTYLTMHVDVVFHSTLMKFMGVKENKNGKYIAGEGVQAYLEPENATFYTIDENGERVLRTANLFWIFYGNLLMKIPYKKNLNGKFFYFDLTRVSQDDKNRIIAQNGLNKIG